PVASAGGGKSSMLAYSIKPLKSGDERDSIRRSNPTLTSAVDVATCFSSIVTREPPAESSVTRSARGAETNSDESMAIGPASRSRTTTDGSPPHGEGGTSPEPSGAYLVSRTSPRPPPLAREARRSIAGHGRRDDREAKARLGLPAADAEGAR